MPAFSRHASPVPRPLIESQVRLELTELLAQLHVGLFRLRTGNFSASCQVEVFASLLDAGVPCIRSVVQSLDRKNLGKREEPERQTPIALLPLRAVLKPLMALSAGLQLAHIPTPRLTDFIADVPRSQAPTQWR